MNQMNRDYKMPISGILAENLKTKPGNEIYKSPESFNLQGAFRLRYAINHGTLRFFYPYK